MIFTNQARNDGDYLNATGKWAWLKVAPIQGDKTTKSHDGKTYHWCTHTLRLNVRKDKALRERSPSQEMVTNQTLHSALLNHWKPLPKTTRQNSFEALAGIYFGSAAHSPLSAIGNFGAIPWFLSCSR
jgi:hypothetical protein